jgi:fructose 1,6-bisphosphatase
MLAPGMGKGFRFVILDVNYTEGDRVIELEAPRDLYAIAALLRDPERYVVESVWSLASGTQAVSVATSRLHNSRLMRPGISSPAGCAVRITCRSCPCHSTPASAISTDRQ